MGHQGKVHSLTHKSMQLRAIVDWSLIYFEDENSISKVKQDDRNGEDKIENWYDAAESQSNQDNGNKEGVSLLNGVYIVVIKLDVLIFGLARCFPAKKLFIPTFSDAFEDIGKDQLNDWEGDIEDHSKNNDGSDVEIPI